MSFRLFQGVSGPLGLFGRARRRRWGPPRFDRRPGRPPLPGGLPPLLDEFPLGGRWGGPGPELLGPPGPWEEDLWDVSPDFFGPGPWGRRPRWDDDF